MSAVVRVAEPTPTSYQTVTTESNDGFGVASQAGASWYNGRVSRVAQVNAGAPAYVFHEQLGEGGMGVVHLGTMRSSAGERQVAIKRLQGDIDPAAAELLAAEARLVFRLTHANICQVLDLALGPDGTFVVMEYVDGLDLQSLLSALTETGGSLDIGSAVHIARDVAKALDYAHRRADSDGQPLLLIHGDVTPKNILLSREGEVKLADFGIARALGAAPGNKLIGGTPGYIAPEALGSGSTGCSDVYSLGVTLAVALGGSTPVDTRKLRAIRPDVSSELMEIIDRATAAQPERRTASAGELEQALSFFLARRFPQHTSSVLAEVVRRHAGRRAHIAAPPTNLRSLSLPEQLPAVVRNTRRMGNRQRPPKKMIAAAILSLLIAAGIWSVSRRSLAPAPPPVLVSVPAPPSVPSSPPLSAPSSAAPIEAMKPAPSPLKLSEKRTPPRRVTKAATPNERAHPQAAVFDEDGLAHTPYSR
jgi:serine/threonine protein kinase